MKEVLLMDLQNVILNHYSNLKGANKKIAKVLLDKPEIFLKFDALNLGKITGTSSATVVRFCQSLGFNGLKDFKIELAQEKPNKSDSERIETIVSEHDTNDTVLKKLAFSVKQNAENTFNMVNTTFLNKAVKLIKEAHIIYIIGIGASSLPAMDLYYKFLRTGRKVMFNMDPHISLESTSFSKPNDVLIAFSYSGLTKEIILMTKEAKENHTPIIVVSRGKGSLLVNLADVVISLPTKERLLRVGAFSSLFSEIYISSLLYLSTIKDDLPRLQSSMRKTESLTNQLKIEYKDKA